MGFRVMVVTVVYLSVLVSLALAVPPQVVDFQGRLTTASGVPVDNGNYTVTFRIYDAETAGNTLWTEQQPVATTNGLSTVMLGSVTTFASAGLTFDRDPLWLGLTVAPDSQEMTPRTRSGACRRRSTRTGWTDSTRRPSRRCRTATLPTSGRRTW